MTDDVTPHRLKAVTPNQLKLDPAAQDVTRRMLAIEELLAADGLTTHLTDARAGLDLTAVLSRSGERDAEICIDEDGYVAMSYWIPEGSTPEQVAAAALRALRAVTRPRPRGLPAA